MFGKEPGMQNIGCPTDVLQQLLTMPLRLHGDEGRYYNLRSVMIFSLGGVRHTNDVYQSRLLLTVLPSTRYSYSKKNVHTGKLGKRKRMLSRKMKFNQTFREISEFLAWSLDVLRSGLFPDQPYVCHQNKYKLKHMLKQNGMV